MAVNLMRTVKRLMNAINMTGRKLTFGTKQYYNRNGQSVTLFIIGEAVWDGDRDRYVNKELYASAKLLDIVMFLRDMWFDITGQTIPDRGADTSHG